MVFQLQHSSLELEDLYHISDDENILQCIKDLININPYISKEDKGNINIFVDDGNVLLAGKVSNKQSEVFAILDSLCSFGVKNVISRITLIEESSENSSDSFLTHI